MMNNQENAAAVIIRQQMLKAEHASNSAAEEAARLVTVLLTKRRELECPLSRGARVIDRGYQALGRSIGCMNSLAMVHQGLHVVADEDDGSQFGPSTTMQPKAGSHLKVA